MSGCSWLGATLGLEMLPSNHAIHDSTMESYTTSISRRSLEGQRNKTGAAMHFLSSSRPPSELGRVFLVSVQPEGTAFPARILSCCRDSKTARLPRDCLLGVPEHILFGVQVRHTSSIASAPVDRWLPIFLPQFWTGNAATRATNSMVFRHRHRQSEFAPFLCPPRPPLPLPMSPFRQTTRYTYTTHNSEVCPRAPPRVN